MGNSPPSSCRNVPVCRYMGEGAGSNPTNNYSLTTSIFEPVVSENVLRNNYIEESVANGLTGDFPFQHQNSGGRGSKDLTTDYSKEKVTFGEPFKQGYEERPNDNNVAKEQNNNTSEPLINSHHNVNNITKDHTLKDKVFIKLTEEWKDNKASLEDTDYKAEDNEVYETQRQIHNAGEPLGNSEQSELNPWPSFIQERITAWDKLKCQYDKEISEKSSENITVTLPNGDQINAQSWRTTPLDLARDISHGLANETIVARVNDQLWDVNRPLETSCELKLLKHTDPETTKVFQYSCAFVLGAAMERVYGGHVNTVSLQETGFSQEMYIPDKKISFLDFPVIENIINNIVKEKCPFERLELKKEDVLEMFKYNKFKQQIIKEGLKTPSATVYRCGPFIDLSRGPLIPDAGKIKAFKVTKKSVVHWKGDPKSEPLQRLHGVAFPNSKQMAQWEMEQEIEAKRDHRRIGRDQELFIFHEMSPGSPFFLPNGAHIYKKLIEFIQFEYRKRGFKEVITPNIFKVKLWETSGHWEHYQSNIFTFNVEEETFALKPMNCPGHCLMFNYRSRSWRELPLRMADFGALHRKEYSGGLSGLTRLYRFQQDDAHVFCTASQIKSEITAALDFLKSVYEVFGFEFELRLSTRPEKFLGDIGLWDLAEKQLAESLDEFGVPWQKSPGEGAFYGPKIDIIIMDFLQRSHQCATIQLDFQLPIRFNLTYRNEHGEWSTPVIIHRAILGSVERMIAILAESYAGKWPFWLSPRQAIVLSIAPVFHKYAVQVHQQLFDAGFACTIKKEKDANIKKHIRNAQLEQFNFILVVGPREVTGKTVNVRTRDNVIHGEFTIPELIKKFQLLESTKSLKDEI